MPSVADRRLGRTRILSRPCSTCITAPVGQRIDLDNERVTQFLRDTVAAGTYVVCHATLPAVAPRGVQPAVCRGFADRFDTQALQIIRRLWGFVEVDPPEGTTHV
jgi:hypothetical protein